MATSTKVVLGVLGGFLVLMVVGCVSCTALLVGASNHAPSGPSAVSGRVATGNTNRGAPVMAGSGQTVSGVKAGYGGQADANVTVTGVGTWTSNNQFDAPKKGQFFAV